VQLDGLCGGGLLVSVGTLFAICLKTIERHSCNALLRFPAFQLFLWQVTSE
jgi:hypothetical protein